MRPRMPLPILAPPPRGASLPPVIPAPESRNPSPPRRGDWPVALPGAEGPLTLSTVEGSSGGRSTIAIPSRPHSPPSPPVIPPHPHTSPVIPRLREESRTCPPPQEGWGEGDPVISITRVERAPLRQGLRDQDRVTESGCSSLQDSSVIPARVKQPAEERDNMRTLESSIPRKRETGRGGRDLPTPIGYPLPPMGEARQDRCHRPTSSKSFAFLSDAPPSPRPSSGKQPLSPFASSLSAVEGSSVGRSTRGPRHSVIVSPNRTPPLP